MPLFDVAVNDSVSHNTHVLHFIFLKTNFQKRWQNNYFFMEQQNILSKKITSFILFNTEAFVVNTD